ncbi:NIL domain-containing protein [Exiguobacterium flavidum]|uniref:NIL domain-containing protein n=1 Tax=Exiguobacterium flavidum TaxID=2184695 RepID=UPI0038B81864
MDAGRIVETGPTFSLFSEPRHPVSRRYVDMALQIELPDEILKRVPGKVIRLQFTGDKTGESTLSSAIKQFDINVSILHGKVDYIQDQAFGVLIVSLTGTALKVDAAIEWLDQQLHALEVIDYVA